MMEDTIGSKFYHFVYRQLTVALDYGIMPFKGRLGAVPVSKFEYLRSTVEYIL